MDGQACGLTDLEATHGPLDALANSSLQLTSAASPPFRVLPPSLLGGVHLGVSPSPHLHTWEECISLCVCACARAHVCGPSDVAF